MVKNAVKCDNIKDEPTNKGGHFTLYTTIALYPLYVCKIKLVQ